jgi:hypothetical protein
VVPNSPAQGVVKAGAVPLRAHCPLHTPEFIDIAETHRADRGMIGVLFEMVNAAPKVARDGMDGVVCCAASQTQRRQNK